jgi:pSer/pThr/pTyr-binding forkhead associated (FHA) protein
MPLTLLLRSAEATARGAVPALTFDGGRVVIGRGSGCDVRLPDPSVSHRHATVRASGKDYVLVDEKSSNGTFVGGTKLAPNTPRALKQGDLIRVGRVWLEVRIDQTPATHDLAVVTRDLALALVSQAMRALGEETNIHLEVVEGRDIGAVLSLAEEGRPYVIGRDASCDLPLADTDVSRTHVQVVRRGGTLLARDAGSKNGAWIGDTRIPAERDASWRPGVTLRLGGTTLAIHDPAAIALSEIEEAEDAPVSPEDIPPQPNPSAAGDSDTDPDASPVPLPPTKPIALARTKASLWNPTDVAVMLAAVAILGLSLVGLLWLLRT